MTAQDEAPSEEQKQILTECLRNMMFTHDLLPLIARIVYTIILKENHTLDVPLNCE